MAKEYIKENEYIDEFKFLQSFKEYFFHVDSKEELLNSTKIRHLIDCSDIPCISTKTFDSSIRILNKELQNNKTIINPAFQTPLTSKPLPLHTKVFYHRLPFFLNLNLYELELYNKQPQDIAQKNYREKLNLLLGLQFSDPSPIYTYTFDIHKFYMPPFFAPLFVGVIGSLSKEKQGWQKFRESTLLISDSFCNENHPEINKFLPKSTDVRNDLYTYWLELYFSDTLFNLISEFDELMHVNDVILSHNINIMTNSLSQEQFFTRINQEKFLQHMKTKLKLYRKTPLVNPITNELSNLDLCEEYSQASNEYHTEETCLLSKWALK